MATDYYVRTGGADVNGGSANTDAATLTKTNCSTDAAGTTLTNDAADGWGSTAADDTICFDTAGTPSYHMITNVAGDVLTIKPAAAELSGKTVNVGGAWATMDHAVSVLPSSTMSDFQNAAVEYIHIHVQGGAYNELATCDNIGTYALPIVLEGYKTNPGDGWAQVWADLPKIDGGGSSNYGIVPKAFWIYRHIWVNNVTGDAFAGTGSVDNAMFEHCRGSSSTDGFSVDNTVYFVGCEADGNSKIGIDTGSSAAVVGCEVHGNETGIFVGGAGAVVGCNAYDQTLRNIQSSGNCTMAYNTIDGNYDGGKTSSIGINLSDTSPAPVVAWANMVHDCNIAFSGGGSDTIVRASLYNIESSNQAANTNWTNGQGDQVDPAGAPGFTDEANADYQPTAASPANGAAGPTTLPAGLTTTNRAVGAAEPATAAGGGVTLVNTRRNAMIGR